MAQVTSATTVYFTRLTIQAVLGSDPEARRWILSHGKSMALLTIVASSRLDMLAILRLKICGRSLIAMPMPDQHFHFIRNSGAPRRVLCSPFCDLIRM